MTRARLDAEIEEISQKHHELFIRDEEKLSHREDIDQDQKQVTLELIEVFNELDMYTEETKLYQELEDNQREWLDGTKQFHERSHRDNTTDPADIWGLLEDDLEEITREAAYRSAFIQGMHDVLMNEELADLADKFQNVLHTGVTDPLLDPMYTQILDTLDKNPFYKQFLHRTDDLREVIRPFRKKYDALVRPQRSSPGI